MSASARVSVLAVDAELDHYTQEAADVNCNRGLSFWLEQKKLASTAAPVAEDLVSAPSSQAYVERVFSACGDMCTRKRIAKHVLA